MLHPGTHLVTEDNGPRPAGKLAECFYCLQPLEALHKENCVLRYRTVIISCAFELCVEVPEHYTTDQIHFFYNEGSHCADNELTQVVALAKQQGCACTFSECKYLREATAEDEKTLMAQSMEST